MTRATVKCTVFHRGNVKILLAGVNDDLNYDLIVILTMAPIRPPGQPETVPLRFFALEPPRPGGGLGVNDNLNSFWQKAYLGV